MFVKYDEGAFCPSCGTGELRIISGGVELVTSDHIVTPSFETVMLLECSQCQEKFQDRQPANGWMA